MMLAETFSKNFTGSTCLPSEDSIIIVQGSTDKAIFGEDSINKAVHFSFIVTLLTLNAIYFTVKELRAIALCLEQRELAG